MTQETTLRAAVDRNHGTAGRCLGIVEIADYYPAPGQFAAKGDQAPSVVMKQQVCGGAGILGGFKKLCARIRGRNQSW